MTTRGAKKLDQQEEADVGASASAAQGAMAAGNQGEKLDELAGLVKNILRSQTTRDHHLDQDFSCQEQR